MDVLRDVIISLATVIACLVAFIKFYIPRNKNNPYSEIPSALKRIEEVLKQHHEATQNWTKEIQLSLTRIEGRQK